MRGLPRILLAALGLPKFHFNEKLFDELIREDANGKPIIPPGNDPEVDFEVGPVSGVLGTYNSKTKRITINVLNVFLSCFGQGPKDIRKRFDEEMTETLAHEGGHWQLEKRYGWLPNAEKVAVHLLFMMIGIAMAGGLWFSAVHVTNSWGRAAWAAPHSPIHILELFCLLLIGIAIWLVIRFFLETWHALSFGVTYHLCYTERYARTFEKRPENDHRWDDVITT